jgi:hypothetical protein
MIARRGRPRKGTTVESDLPALFELWNRATTSPYGIGVKSCNPHQLAAKLYRARRECGHDAYDDLRIVELADEVRIIHRENERLSSDSA